MTPLTPWRSSWQGPRRSASGLSRSRTLAAIVTCTALVLAGCNPPRGLAPGQRSTLPAATVLPSPVGDGRATPLPTPEDAVEVAVVEVVDGDTIRVRLDGGTRLVRYTGINAPETGEGYREYEWLGPEATDVNASLIGGSRVRLERDVSDTDAYGRLLRYVWSDGLLLNAEMVRLGYAQARAYPPDTRYAEILEALEAEARAAELGVWGERPTEVPAERATDAGCAYIGNVRSARFHRPDCEAVPEIAPGNRVCVGSREEALAAGLAPCGICRP